MPKLPSIGLDAVSAHPVGGQAVVANGAAQGLAQLGQALGEVGGVIKDAYDHSKATAALSAAQKEAQDFQLQLQNGGIDPETNEPMPPPPPEQHKQLFDSEIARINEKYQSKLSNRSLRMFNESFTEFSNRQGLSIQSGAIDLMQSKARANNDMALEQSARNFVNESNPLVKSTIQKDALTTIADLEERHIYTPQQALAARTKYAGDTAGGSILKIMKQSPLDVVKAIDSGEFNELPADTLQRYRNQAIAQDRADRLERKKQKDTQDATFKSALDMASNPKGSTLTLDWIHANRENLDKEDYKAAIKLSTGEGVNKPSNRFIQADLFIRAQTGDDVSIEAQSHFLRGDLNTEDWKAIQSAVETHSIGFQANNWGQNGAKYIKEGMIPKGGMAKPDDNVVAADALMDWSNWVKNNPKATSEQGAAEAKRIVDQRLLLNVHNMITSFRLPRYFTGNRGEMNMETLGKSYDATVEAHDKGELTDYDFGEEMKKIRDFKDKLPKIEPKVAK
jgi:hypothetical protein